MSAQPPVERDGTQPLHYQVLCGLALGAMFLVLLQQGEALLALAVLLLGATPIVVRGRISPVFVVLVLVGGLLAEQYFYLRWRPHAALEVEDVALCAATLAYVAGHYRLLSIWRQILPADPRQRVPKEARSTVPRRLLGRVVLQPRPANLLSRGELAWFVIQLPLFALLAQGVWIMLSVEREVQELPPRLVQMLQAAWGLALVLFLGSQFFRFWRIFAMDRVTARHFLQDVLWHELRGEQRRIGRWLAWWRLSGGR
jgi:hypothetical protein